MTQVKPDPVGQVVQWVAKPIANPRVLILIPARADTFVEIDHEIFSTVILLLQLNQEGLLSFTRESICTEYWLTA